MEGVNFKEIRLSKSDDSFAVAIDTKGVLYSWGNNQHGQLGHGDYTDKDLPTQVMQLRRKAVS